MIRASILGGSGFTGGEILRLLLQHPQVSVTQVTSRRLAGKPVYRAHPNLRGATELTFSGPEDLEPCDVLFLALPHGESSRRWEELRGMGERIVDLSADFRLTDPDRYARHYGPHRRPELMKEFVYALPEVSRGELEGACYAAAGGCNAAASILALLPLYRAGVVDSERTVIDVLAAASEGGARPNPGSHFPVRSGSLRPYRPTGHRHVAELEEVLLPEGGGSFHMSVTATPTVRGVLATAHVFLNEPLSPRDIWRIFRDRYREEPFVRVVAERRGHYRLPDPKLLAGTNFCDVGFEYDPPSGRLVVLSAIDNLMKGAAGQAVQAMNLMLGLPETLALEFLGLHPL